MSVKSDCLRKELLSDLLEKMVDLGDAVVLNYRLLDEEKVGKFCVQIYLKTEDYEVPIVYVTPEMLFNLLKNEKTMKVLYDWVETIFEYGDMVILGEVGLFLTEDENGKQSITRFNAFNRRKTAEQTSADLALLKVIEKKEKFYLMQAEKIRRDIFLMGDSVICSFMIQGLSLIGCLENHNQLCAKIKARSYDPEKLFVFDKEIKWLNLQLAIARAEKEDQDPAVLKSGVIDFFIKNQLLGKEVERFLFMTKRQTICCFEKKEEKWSCRKVAISEEFENLLLQAMKGGLNAANDFA